MPATASVPPRSRASNAGGTRVPTGAKRMAASRGSGGGSSASPALAAPSSRARRPGLRGPGHHMDSGSFGHGDLGGEVGRTAEAVDPQPTAGRKAGPSEGPVADDAGAEQGGCLLVAEGVGQGIGEGLLGDDVLGVAPVEVPAREPRRRDTDSPGRPCRSGTSRTYRASHGTPTRVRRAEAAGALPQPVHHAHHLVTGHDQVPSGADPLRPDGDRSDRLRRPGRAGGAGRGPAPGHPGGSGPSGRRRWARAPAPPMPPSGCRSGRRAPEAPSSIRLGPDLTDHGGVHGGWRQGDGLRHRRPRSPVGTTDGSPRSGAAPLHRRRRRCP